jgi:hypothetical protein
VGIRAITDEVPHQFGRRDDDPVLLEQMMRRRGRRIPRIEIMRAVVKKTLKKTECRGIGGLRKAVFDVQDSIAIETVKYLVGDSRG